MKTKETSTREQASKWFGSKSYLEQHELSDKYFESRNPSLLTIKQVEEIWMKETQNNVVNWDENPETILKDKPNQKQLPVICLNCKEIYNNPIKQCNCGSKSFQNTHPSNAKQFKQFDESLFKAYINKFSDKDKVAALRVLFKSIGITSKDKLKYFLARY